MSVRRQAALVAVVAVIAGGCSDEPEPRFEEPTATPSASESESADPQAQTPEEFIREWFELNTKMQNTGETKAFLTASTEGCIPCKGLAARVERIYDNGGSVHIEDQRVERIRSGSRSARIRQFEVVVRAAPTVLVETETSAEQRYEGGQSTFELTLHRGSKQWRMDNIVELG